MYLHLKVGCASIKFKTCNQPNKKKITICVQQMTTVSVCKNFSRQRLRNAPLPRLFFVIYTKFQYLCQRFLLFLEQHSANFFDDL
jgi:hypothetical protein